MLLAYIQAAMHQAEYELLPEHEGFYGHIPALPGAWANAHTLEACRDELQSVVEGWIILGLRMGDDLPVIAGINLTPPLVEEAIPDDEADDVPAAAPAAAV